MKKFVPIFLLGAFVLFLTCSNVLQGDDTFEAQISAIKQDCKDNLDGARYEGSKITYFVPGTQRQTKTVEVFFLLRGEYYVAISAKKASVAVNIRLYDAAEDVPERTLLKEYKNVGDQVIVLKSEELNEIYRQKVPNVERIKNLFVDYQIAAGKPPVKEAVVMVMGRKPL